MMLQSFVSTVTELDILKMGVFKSLATLNGGLKYLVVVEDMVETAELVVEAEVIMCLTEVEEDMATPIRVRANNLNVPSTQQYSGTISAYGAGLVGVTAAQLQQVLDYLSSNKSKLQLQGPVDEEGDWSGVRDKVDYICFVVYLHLKCLQFVEIRMSYGIKEWDIRQRKYYKRYHL
ncbi:uncharacterized protein LOC113273869 [Papaver somniferum]|uniref:uncharacterized protein LOC113273869 n=1 Tax=Papaver somniferum TaxID=3469 RepID=UPI000E6F4A1D|nr:uncharacterized protein LOC113273869 [Papaver somniferum]